ncbi:transposon Tf2-1 polyprotein isoform X1 [Cucumis melo var. makuwa]|uniref:Transposon Tf2-1 polyprotein isoform X1 n=1 Tax=Cucumis melo var. makuwa TaxID=1194695 RepID=A0A5D3DTJ2_CUCMM|nr:transposon Tf2-1 polyprotein isoform X1 [Cucumis melo var. makuwa]TYK26822.1 transposon Tf2-1 polyprotein isoform X1 [Cucumis melo var. makuwa]
MRDRAKPVYERELMVVVLAVQRWHPYLLGTKFVVKTDQKSLKFLLEQRTIQPQYQKWVAKLLGYSFEVVYKSGLENKATDTLSRKPVEVLNFGISVPILIDLTTIKEEVEKDVMLQKVITEKMTAMLSTYHDSVVGGHSGFLRTYKRLASELYWTGMKADVKKHCEECLVCQRNKTLALSPAGLLTPLEIPQQVWSDISMDFIDGLPKAKGFEVVFVVVDRLSKYSHFMPLKHPYTAKSVADVFVKEVVQLHGFPSSIVSDRDKVFLSNFWKRAGDLSSLFCGARPKEWVSWLPWAEYWYNITFNRSLGASPFQVLYGRKPPSLSYGDGATTNSTLAEQLSARDTVLAALQDQLLLAQQQMKQYADKKRRHVEYNKFVGDRTGVQPTLQFINENLEWQAYPDEALKYQKNNAGGWEVLIHWKDLPEHEASWECYNEIQRLYPTFHLEDKVKLEEEGNVRPPPIKFVYKRRNK